ncbi:MAG: glycoside hydrolase family 43 protein [Schaedlerella sp.]|uniref:glycoside hydrolase family 43 protein n=1 Tax=Schaedlerella sp. TaxID=2676057 RepID=UPI003528F0F5
MKKKLINPIIPGFYPDPSICRVGGDYYLACSSFELCPGVPIFHSRDLAHWEQICYAMTPENGFHMERDSGVGGVMAPTLRYHDGLFYIINANFSDKGNYIVTAEDPAGPWSEPHWLDDVPGIDASLFFDDDGQAYIMGTGDVWDNGTGVKERGIWLAKYDVEHFHMLGEPVTIFNSALRVGSSPESPHLYHIGEYYYLIIAEGGTEHYHAVMAARSKELFGFYEGNPANPVMTHRHMGFKSPIINVGHADFVELPDGSWYAVMLASRLIEGKCKILGRETFICPVVWERDWPLFSPETGKVEWEYDAPECLPWEADAHSGELGMVRKDFEEKDAHSGGFGVVHEDFDKEELDLCWSFWGRPYHDFYKIENSALHLKCIRQSLIEELRPMSFGAEKSEEYDTAFLACRQCSINTTVTCGMKFLPEGQESAGLAIVQAMNHQYHLERAVSQGRQVLRLMLYTADYNVPPYFPGFTSETHREVIAEVPWEAEEIVLQFGIQGEHFAVRYGETREALKELCVADGERINPEKVGCMTGTMIGMYATGNGEDCETYAEFGWFEMR